MLYGKTALIFLYIKTTHKTEAELPCAGWFRCPATAGTYGNRGCAEPEVPEVPEAPEAPGASVKL